MVANGLVPHNTTDAIFEVLKFIRNIPQVVGCTLFNFGSAVIEAIVETITSIGSAFWNPDISAVCFGRLLLPL